MSIQSVLSAASRGWRLILGVQIAAAMLAAPGAAQTLTSVLKPGSPEIAETLCARLHALGLPGARVFALEGSRVQVEHPAEPLVGITPEMVTAVLTRPGQISLHAAASEPVLGLVAMETPDPENGPVYVAPAPLMTSYDLAQAEMILQYGRPALYFSVTADGASRLAEFTGQSIGQVLAIVVDGQVLAAPVVRQPILDGTAVISNLESAEEAMVLAAILTGGPLPDDMELLGAQLGSSGPDAVPTCTSD